MYHDDQEEQKDQDNQDDQGDQGDHWDYGEITSELHLELIHSNSSMQSLVMHTVRKFQILSNNFHKNYR